MWVPILLMGAGYLFLSNEKKHGINSPESNNFEKFKKEHPYIYKIIYGAEDFTEDHKLFFDEKEALEEFESLTPDELDLDLSQEDNFINLTKNDYNFNDEIIDELSDIDDYDEFVNELKSNYLWDDYFDIDEIEHLLSKSVERENKNTEQLIEEVLEELSKETGVNFRKYTDIIVKDGKILNPESDEYWDCEVENDYDCKKIQVRIADHTHNIKNGRPDVTVVIANKDYTKDKFNLSETDLYFDGNYDADEIANEIIEYIESNYS